MGYQEYTSLHKIIIGILCCSTNKYRTEKESVKDNEMSDMVNVRKYHIKSSS
jgi:coenzyme F420-reducing hydrogenase beta subunit